MKTCGECGSEFDERYIFCPDDGALLVEPQLAAATHETIAQPAPPPISETPAAPPVLVCTACLSEYPPTFHVGGLRVCPLDEAPLLLPAEMIGAARKAEEQLKNKQAPPKTKQTPSVFGRTEQSVDRETEPQPAVRPQSLAASTASTSTAASATAATSTAAASAAVTSTAATSMAATSAPDSAPASTSAGVEGPPNAEDPTPASVPASAVDESLVAEEPMPLEEDRPSLSAYEELLESLVTNQKEPRSFSIAGAVTALLIVVAALAAVATIVGALHRRPSANVSTSVRKGEQLATTVTAIAGKEASVFVPTPDAALNYTEVVPATPKDVAPSVQKEQIDQRAQKETDQRAQKEQIDQRAQKEKDQRAQKEKEARPSSEKVDRRHRADSVPHNDTRDERKSGIPVVRIEPGPRPEPRISPAAPRTEPVARAPRTESATLHRSVTPQPELPSVSSLRSHLVRSEASERSEERRVGERV